MTHHPDALYYKEDAPGWSPPEPLTLNAKPHALLYILFDVNIEGGQDLYMLKIAISRDIQDKRAFPHIPQRPKKSLHNTDHLVKPLATDYELI